MKYHMEELIGGLLDATAVYIKIQVDGQRSRSQRQK